jgi:hypothetical protein
LNYITGIPVLYKILKKIHNTGTNFYTSDRQVFFCQHLNDLPQELVQAKTVKSFEILLDKYWENQEVEFDYD